MRKKVLSFFVSFFYEIAYFLHKLFCCLLCIFPIDSKKIHISCWNGRGGYSDNPKYIIEELESTYPNEYKIYWSVIDPEKTTGFPEFVHLVKYHSFISLFHQITAFLWIDNCRKDMPYKRKKQYYLQTWHGSGPLKKIEADVEDALVMGYKQNAKKDSKMISAILSGSAIESYIYKNSFWYNGPVLEFGSPRTDFMFKANKKDLKTRFCKEVGIPVDSKLVLYAPTFRDKASKDFDYSIDIDSVINALNEKWKGKWFFLLRTHKNNDISFSNLKTHPKFIDVTLYPDMQELLSLIDVAIDDYSSWMFDLLYNYCPCFIYAPDYDSYVNKRGFYIDFNSLPFTKAKDIDGLCGNICSFDFNSYKNNCKKFLDSICSYNDGMASAKVVAWIKGI